MGFFTHARNYETIIFTLFNIFLRGKNNLEAGRDRLERSKRELNAKKLKKRTAVHAERDGLNLNANNFSYFPCAEKRAFRVGTEKHD